MSAHLRPFNPEGRHKGEGLGSGKFVTLTMSGKDGNSEKDDLSDEDLILSLSHVGLIPPLNHYVLMQFSNHLETNRKMKHKSRSLPQTSAALGLPSVR